MRKSFKYSISARLLRSFLGEAQTSSLRRVRVFFWAFSYSWSLPGWPLLCIALLSIKIRHVVCSRFLPDSACAIKTVTFSTHLPILLLIYLICYLTTEEVSNCGLPTRNSSLFFFSRVHKKSKLASGNFPARIYLNVRAKNVIPHYTSEIRKHFTVIFAYIHSYEENKKKRSLLRKMVYYK